jgi:hypothetical protein
MLVACRVSDQAALLYSWITSENSLERNGVRVIQRLYGSGINCAEVAGDCR